MFQNFFNNCTPILLLLLLLAFLLGWLFWHFFKGKALWEKISGLESDKTELGSKLKVVKKELSGKDKTYASLNKEYEGLNTKYGSMESSFLAEQKAKTTAEVELEEWKKKYTAVDANWSAEKSRVTGWQTRYNTDMKIEQQQRVRLDGSYKSLQTKYAELEQQLKDAEGRGRKWENDYTRLKAKHDNADEGLVSEVESLKTQLAAAQSQVEAAKAEAIQAEANNWNIKLAAIEKEREEEKNQWNLKWADLEREKDAEINQLNLKWTNFENSQKDNSGDWEAKLAALRSENQAAIKANNEEWEAKWANYKQEAQVEKDAAVKEEHDRWSLKWEAHQKEMAAAKAEAEKMPLAVAVSSDDEKKAILKEAKQFYPRIKWDDLKVVEGIGPKIEGLCHDIGIKTWKALSEADYDTLKKMLTDAGSRYQMHDPKTWPKQAGMAYRNEWKELNKWQDEHSHGRE